MSSYTQCRALLSTSEVKHVTCKNKLLCTCQGPHSTEHSSAPVKANMLHAKRQSLCCLCTCQATHSAEHCSAPVKSSMLHEKTNCYAHVKGHTALSIAQHQ